ncbi:hypothetical protein E2562_029311 [Oryza meyeriana var. granulata]|uniref:Uncharacterized protein n=1 Tax=Oryza meyeriana var. granulata TaxID=110450 RepID=A0A6G1E5Z3_9ORYZ|nr:hypothetical protein E2562_029311 [Oryza meyeriana var. granulata]
MTEEEEVSTRGDGDVKKRKKVVKKRVGKEERLMSYTVTVPTVSNTVLASAVVPARHKEIAVESIAITIRERQDVSDSGDHEIMQPV